MMSHRHIPVRIIPALFLCTVSKAGTKQTVHLHSGSSATTAWPSVSFTLDNASYFNASGKIAVQKWQF
jgi:hypothetical protein